MNYQTKIALSTRRQASSVTSGYGDPSHHTRLVCMSACSGDMTSSEVDLLQVPADSGSSDVMSDVDDDVDEDDDGF